MNPRPGAVRARLSQWLHPQHPAFLLAILLVPMMAVRTYLVLRFGSSSPFWDQWDAEFDNLLLPYLRGELGLGHLLAAHNEHRILFTRLISLGLFSANGNQFDAKVEMLFNILPHAAALGAMAFVGMRTLPATARPFLVLGVFAVTAAPFGWENLIAGFQNQFFILALLSVVTVWLASADVLDRRRLLAMVACAVLALFTMATGVLAAAAAAGLLIYRLLGRDINTRTGWLGVALMMAIAGAGLLAMPPAPHGAAFHAQSMAQFIEALKQTLSWPMRPRWTSVLVLWAPTITLTVVLLKRLLSRQPATRGERFAFAIAGWVLVQAVAMAYSRGVEVHNGVTSRYTDLLAIGVINNLWLVLHAAFRHGRALPQWAKATVPAVFIGWLALSSYPIFMASQASMAHRAVIGSDQERILAAYLADGNIDALRNAPALLPYPDADRQARLLDSAEGASMMPAEIRRPLAFSPTACNGISRPGAYVTLGSKPQALGTYEPASGDANTTECSSEPVAFKGGRVVYFQGGYGPPLVSATLVGKQHTVELVKRGVAGERWEGHVLTLPADEYRLRVVDKDPHGWVAVTPPTPVGALTALRMWAEERRGPGLFVALVLTLMLLTVAVVRSSNRGGEALA
ncbi:hypothetical protein [Stenotrophomonas sp.]|uniref:hypothetical protein n=1 Tax=Stenotrophomonas sp. TaxID=69392 RepID=UPI0028A9F539|nr:hypothetical protein [Stenotrophomonas sp.]